MSFWRQGRKTKQESRAFLFTIIPHGKFYFSKSYTVQQLPQEMHNSVQQRCKIMYISVAVPWSQKRSDLFKYRPYFVARQR